MARKRMIDPSFWEDEKLGAIEPMARLLFMGLISQADDEGRLKGHPSLLRSNIFPYDDGITIEQIESWLVLLGSLIVRYEVDRQRYIFIKNFKKHQTINKPQESKLPSPPDDYGSDTVVIPEDEGSDTSQKKLKEENLKEGEVKGKGIEMPPPDSNPHKDRIHKLINDCKIEDYTLNDLDVIYSYIGVCDIEVIEYCIKKGQAKHVNYAIRTLQGKVKEGITKKEQVLPPKPEVGENNAKSEGLAQGMGGTVRGNQTKGISYEGQSTVSRSKWDDVIIPMPGVQGRGRETG